MGWFSNILSPSSSSASARRKMTLSTHDAFSLPTSSPITASHADSFSRSSPETPGPDTATSQSYAYPPPMSSPTTYDYVPRQNGRLPSSQSRQSSLLPLHKDAPLPPLPPYPPLDHTWARLRNWLSREYPELGDTLNYGILPQELGEIEMALGLALPAPVRESYLLVDGQEAESSAGCSDGLFFGLTFLPLEDVLEEWRFWREVDSDPATGANSRLKEVMQSIPPGWVRREYSQRGWIPLVTDKTGNYLGVDLNPDKRGAAGQVIVFGRDFDTKVVMWRGDGSSGWAHWLANFVDDLENGEGFELGQTSDGSEDEEDDVGYESYFFDGSGRAKGEGGGDSGGGLRLTGEYRGWSVLEAWADRSAKRWREAGLIPQPSAEPKSKSKGAKHGLGVLDIPAGSSNSGAEVPIPVLADEQDSKTPTAALPNVTDRVVASPSSNGPPTVLPTISVTKAPAPRPVILPSPGDFQSPSPTESRATSFDNDLETGRKLSLDEVRHPLSGANVSVKPPTPTTPTARRPNDLVLTVKETSLVHIPLDKPIPEKYFGSVSDLLQQNDSSDGVPIAPIEPVATPISEHNVLLDADAAIRTPVLSAETPSDVLPADVEEAKEEFVEEAPAEESKEESVEDYKEAPAKETKEESVEEAPAEESKEELKEEFKAESEPQHEEKSDNPDQTIRLVGGGGLSGTVDEPETVVSAEGEPDCADVVSISSATSVRSSADVDSPSGAKHKKRGLSSGLKRISKLGAGRSKRRTDSKEKI